MKRLFSLLTITLIISFSSCGKKFYQEPDERTTETDVFDPNDKLGTLATSYLLGIYSFLPTGFNRIDGDFLDAATDDAVPSSPRSNIVLFNNGQLTAVNYPDNNWANSYTIIRRCNVFLQNIDVVPFSDASVKKREVAEVHFLRAFAYFELVKRYGGVPLVGDKVFSLDDNMNIPRNTFSDCVDYIAAECDLAIPGLTLASALSSNEYGRATVEAAMALKCRLFLYAASPLYNGGGVETNAQIKALTGYPTADATRWQKVITAAEALMSIGYHKLPAGTGATAYAAVFTTKINTDIIFAKQSAASVSIENANAPVGYVSPNTSNGRNSPTQNLLNAFPNADGSAYTGSSTSLTQYTGRDPRLQAIIFYNGVNWLGRAVQTFEGGLDKPNTPLKTQTRTAYYLRKFMADFSTATNYANQSHNFPYFRYAEVLLNYAEALNEVGRTEDAVKQLIPIRARAGITAGVGNRYGIKAGISQTELRDLIRNDRRIELCFEEHRFWDLRRWKLGSVLASSLQGLQLTPNGTTYNVQVVDVAQPVFQDKYYHMPIPYSETAKNTKLIQNEGYY
ncbi:putative outer membrane starch-binding protein [Mucilaginibacter yixingensis]|uniref:Putative outer membrane starch-binding protein n=1 Tax=Mucilaginibacter yixingensis TaxID=1295612 RepID=A0A2T5JAJ9_9SPHI|nr:RagB/SusD family nutrient uptake outer membrane protein [Mucilaginibacter yixingensis]PTQ97886.1 putative outer membrane starch-binding protein [Mucilaginibacter yixingensis]